MPKNSLLNRLNRIPVDKTMRELEKRIINHSYKNSTEIFIVVYKL